MTESVREATGFLEWPTYEGEGVSFYYGYKHVVATGMQFLRQMEWKKTANVFGALLWEPRVSIQTGMAMGQEMNPSTEINREKSPVLALHGKDGSPGMFLALGKYFRENGLGDLYTVQLAGGELTERDLEVINKKLDEMKILYGEDVKIDILGYSRGAELALYAALSKEKWRIEEGGECFLSPSMEWRKEVGKIIRIGSMTLQSEWTQLSDEMKKSIYEIRGKDDIHMPQPSYAINQYEVDGVGHIGLVSSSLVFDHVKAILG